MQSMRKRCVVVLHQCLKSTTEAHALEHTHCIPYIFTERIQRSIAVSCLFSLESSMGLIIAQRFHYDVKARAGAQNIFLENRR